MEWLERTIGWGAEEEEPNGRIQISGNRELDASVMYQHKLYNATGSIEAQARIDSYIVPCMVCKVFGEPFQVSISLSLPPISSASDFLIGPAGQSYKEQNSWICVGRDDQAHGCNGRSAVPHTSRSGGLYTMQNGVTECVDTLAPVGVSCAPSGGGGGARQVWHYVEGYCDDVHDCILAFVLFGDCPTGQD